MTYFASSFTLERDPAATHVSLYILRKVNCAPYIQIYTSKSVERQNKHEKV